MSASSELEREGEIAADFLEELLDIADVDGDIDMDVEDDRASVSVVGGDLDSLIGAEGSTLEALQELTRLAVLRETGTRSKLMLDIGRYRAEKRERLLSIGQEAVERARQTGETVALETMNAFERKVIHDVVAGENLKSESAGEEPNRYVVIEP